MEGPWCWLHCLVGYRWPDIMVCAAAGYFYALISSPPGWYSAPKAIGTSLVCAKLSSLLRSVDGSPGREMWSAVGSASCSLRVGGGAEGGLLESQGVVIFKP